MNSTSYPVGATVADVSDVRDYWLLLKPNVMSLVVFSAAAGLVLAPGEIHPILALVAILAVATGAGAAAAINNSYDVDIDRLMVRTRRRPTAAGRIPPAEALAFGIALSIVSIMVMGLALNWVAASLLAFTIAFYVLVYTLWLKRRTPQNIVIGGAAGAIPPVVGWAAVTGDVSLFPMLLFLIIFMWTPPHFWALSLYRAADYERAGVPMLPVVAGGDATRRHVLAYTLLLVPVTLLPYLLGFTGWFYGLAVVGLNAVFVGLAYRLHRDRTQRTATRTFRFSLLYLFAVFAALVIDDALLGGVAG